MLVSVSTIKEPLPKVRTFVEQNLSRGLDHMFVFVDDGDGDGAVAAFLRDHPHVTAIEAGPDWWSGDRPHALNGRQAVNANVVKAVLTLVRSAEWLVTIDSDEVVDLDRERLERLPAETRVVHLRPLEAVSRRRSRKPPREFKRLLEDDELVLLRALGVLPNATNRAYFHGHINGKSGLRPSLDLRVAIHRPLDSSGDPVPAFEADWLRLLHLHTFSRDEFVRRWRDLLGSGPLPRLRRGRSELATAINALGSRDLPPRTAERYLTRLYEHTTEDDVRTLRDLGLLERIDLGQRRYVPRGLPADDLRVVDQLLERLAPEDKRVFMTGAPEQARDALDRAASSVPLPRNPD